MIVELKDGKRWKVYFEYDYNYVFDTFRGEIITRRTKVVIEVVVENAENIPVSWGAAFCSPDDLFVKETGRKIALNHALGRFPRETRTIVWKAYFNRK